MHRLRELPAFVRINICLYAASLAAIGYLLFSRPSPMLIYVVLSSFFGCAAAYAYNNTTDLKEDLINRKKLNYFSDKPAGKAIVALCTIAGLYFALLLSSASLLVYLSFTSLGFTYSYFRIKKYLLLKNLWTSFSLSQSLLFGSFAVSAGAASIGPYAVAFLMALTGSVIADMRDAEGDIKAGITTLPVKYGIARSAQVVYALFILAAASTLAAGPNPLYILIPFMPASMSLTSNGRFTEAHATGGLSFLILLGWLLSKGGQYA